MTEANAVHMPRNFDPMAYEYIGAFDSEPEPYSYFSRQWSDFTMPDGTVVHAAHAVHAEVIWLKDLLGASPTSRWEDRGQCDHCGAHIRYVVVVRHLPTGDHIAVGETCADHRIQSMTRGLWKVAELRKAAQAAREAAKTRAGKEANAELAPDVLAWLGSHSGFIPRPLFELRRDHERGIRWTPEALPTARAEIAAYDAEAKRRAEAKKARELSARPAPSGKVTVTGTVKSVKFQDSMYGGAWKMLVDADEGFRVWITVPTNIYASAQYKTGVRVWLPGKRVTFTATLEPKQDDPTFAFGKRPTQAKVVGE